jgi:hypothetical protein
MLTASKKQLLNELSTAYGSSIAALFFLCKILCVHLSIFPKSELLKVFESKPPRNKPDEQV